MNLKGFSDSQLVCETKKLVSEERRVTTEILHHLHETEARGLHSELRYGSIFEYAVKELRYSETCASRRISAMRAMYEMPELEAKLKTGEMSVTVVAQVQSFFRAEQRENNKTYTIKEKRELLAEVAGKSKREVERTLVTISPRRVAPEQVVPINATQTELRFTVDESLLAKLKQVQAYLSHQNPSNSMAKTIELLADSFLERKQSRLKEKVAPAQKTTSHSRYIPETIKKEVWRRAGGRCQFVSPITKERCASSYLLQNEHAITPYALGGGSTLENLELLCAAHNRFRAIQVYGKEKMAQFQKRRQKFPYVSRISDPVRAV